MSKLVPLGTSFNLFQAQVIRSKLEANEILCHLFDQNTFSAMSHLSLAIGGVRLMVHESDLEAAKEILQEIDLEEQNDKL